MCLMLGSPGVGKTLLLKRLQYCSHRGSYAHVDDVPGTIPTVGTNLVNVVTVRRQEVTLREIGGVMGPIWKNFFADCRALIMVVDVSNRTQLASSCIQLYEVLSHEALEKCPVLLLLNKIDISGGVSRAELEFILRLEEVRTHCPHPISVLEASAATGAGLRQVAKWIQDNVKT